MIGGTRLGKARRARMRFEKYLEEYVRDLTGQHSLRANVLVNVCERKDHAREACFFYLLARGKMPDALALAEGTSFEDEWADVYEQVRQCLSFEDLWRMEQGLPTRYGKVLRSYRSEAERARRCARLKLDMREDFLSWSQELGLSNRSVAIRAGVDPSNFNAFMRNRDVGRLSIDAVARVGRVYVAELRRCRPADDARVSDGCEYDSHIAPS